jgi:eukaryotic-like serine/threonine-protein kinase
MSAPIHLERPRVAANQTTLPTDLRGEQSLRVQLFFAAGALMWAITLAMDLTLAPHGDRGPYRGVVEACGVALCAASVLLIRYGSSLLPLRLSLGVATVPLHALLLALLNSWTPLPTNVRGLSGITVLVLFFGLTAPARPRTLVTVGLIAASMDPLGVWLAHLRGLPVPDPLTAVLLFYPNYVCAFLAAAPSLLVYRLGRELRAARALGSYELVERIGSGGMGEVWVARHRLLARQAAIKVVRPDFLGDVRERAVALERFEREAKATAGLTSAHTVRLFDFGTTDEGAFYYVMELLDGRDLQSLVDAHGPMPPARAMHLVRQICASLAEAHAMGLIHRDVKPANVYVCRQGLEYDVVKVLDFGLVRPADRSAASTWATAAAVTMGTPAYMAPEAILGEASVDRRADVYAIGCVAYFLLSGGRVFAGPSAMRLLMQHLNDAPVPPSQRVSHPIPPAVDAFVMACLQKNPAARPADAGVLMEMAEACVAGAGWGRRAAEDWWKRHVPQHARRTEVRAS